MKLFIPRVGDIIQLSSPWTFDLYDEDRNFTLMRFLSIPLSDRRWSDPMVKHAVTIPAGAQLKFDRLYVRKGENSNMDSATFYWLGKQSESYTEIDEWSRRPKTYPRRPVRFWAVIDDTRRIDFEEPT